MIKRVNYSLDRRTICFEIIGTLKDLYDENKKSILYNNAEENMMFSYYDNERAIGFCSLLSHNFYALEISMIAVSVDMQNKKIGSLLLKEAYQYAKNNDYKIIEVKVPIGSNFLLARKFFEKKKFILLEEMNGYHIMVLPISSEVL